MSVVAQRAPGEEMSLEEINAEIDRLRELIHRDQQETRRLREESRAQRRQTQAILDELKAMNFSC